MGATQKIIQLTLGLERAYVICMGFHLYHSLARNLTKSPQLVRCGRCGMPLLRSRLPLGQDLPTVLAPRRPRTPAVGILFLIFVGQATFKAAAPKVQIEH